MHRNIQPIVPIPPAVLDQPGPADATTRVTFRIQPTGHPTQNSSNQPRHEDALPAGPVRQDLVRRIRKLIREERYDNAERVAAASAAMMRLI